MLYIWGILWLGFGSCAIITAILNISWAIRGKDAKWFRFISLSFTALTLCAFYSQAKQWAVLGDFSALLDVMPALSAVLWLLAIASILINSISLFIKKVK